MAPIQSFSCFTRTTPVDVRHALLAFLFFILRSRSNFPLFFFFPEFQELFQCFRLFESVAVLFFVFPVFLDSREAWWAVDGPVFAFEGFGGVGGHEDVEGTETGWASEGNGDECHDGSLFGGGVAADDHLGASGVVGFS